jgi:outer membrane protein
VVQAQSDLASAQVQRIQAENAYRTSKVQLNQAMGREGPGDFELGDDSLPPLSGEELSFAALMEEAVRARPEISQLEAQIRAQQSTLSSIKGAFWPTLGVSASFNAGGQDFTAFAWNGSAQATLTWPLFQGLLTQSQAQEASATLDAVMAQRDGLRQQVALELEQARLAVQADQLALASSGDAVKLAHERLDLAEARYQTGAGSIIELTDAQTAYTNASGQRVKSEYDLAVARAQLLKALGRP